jgi:Tol biopolymer transport system component
MSRFGLAIAGWALFGIAHAAEPTAAANAGATIPNTAAAAPDFELALVDMQGQKKVLGTLPNSVFAPRLSPDGSKVAFELTDDSAPAATRAQTRRIYVADLDKLDKRRALQMTITTTMNYAPVWSPDGDWVIFLASGNGNDALYKQHSDGYIQPLYVIDGRAAEGWYKGGLLAFITRKDPQDYGISLLDMNTRKVTLLVDLPGNSQHSSRISPDGRWLAYASNETGRFEVWLEPLPQTGKRFQLTKQGGGHPLWSPDGKTLYFDHDDRMFRMDVTLDPANARASDPAALPIAGFQQGEARRQFDLTPDGRAFLMLFPVRTAP